ncbi:MAG: hypothetical protein MK207_05030, partial [Saprospiraceae bacterium]|nr:hypothetical protein [Saprospiraceae bacterium]
MKFFQWILPILILFTNITTSYSQTYCNLQDSIALERLSINLGLSSLPVDPWSTIAPPHDWYGIDTIHNPFVPNEYRIVKIDLSNQINASGNIPDTLFNNDQLHFLDTLILSNIGSLNFTDTICKQTSGIAPKLKYIDISNNNFSSLNLDVFVLLLTNMDNLNTIMMDNC